MPKGAGQKLKLHYLSRIMLQETDDEHTITMPQIQMHLAAYGITADRKSLYDDLEALQVLGIEIIGEKKGRDYVYHVGKKDFEIAELKLLVDAIQSSKFITEKKSNELIKKLESYASRFEAGQLNRQVVVKGRIKTMNESIYYTVDDIHNAISYNKKIRFEYMHWTTSKKLEPKKDKIYEVSPWAFSWDDENYYLIAYDKEADMIKHYRVDKIRKVQLLDERREGKELFKDFDLAAYARMSFGMFSGERTRVKIEFAESLVGVMIDRFGKEIKIVPSKKGWYLTDVEVALSDQFYGWIFSLGTDVKLKGPKAAVERYKEEVAAVMKAYD